MAGSVFISHASADASTAKLAVAVLKESGVPCWVAPRDVPATGALAGEIWRAVEGCRAMVLILTRAADRSDPVADEVALARKCGKTVYGLRVEAFRSKGELALHAAISALGRADDTL